MDTILFSIPKPTYPVTTLNEVQAFSEGVNDILARTQSAVEKGFPVSSALYSFYITSQSGEDLVCVHERQLYYEKKDVLREDLDNFRTDCIMVAERAELIANLRRMNLTGDYAGLLANVKDLVNDALSDRTILAQRQKAHDKIKELEWRINASESGIFHVSAKVIRLSYLK